MEKLGIAAFVAGALGLLAALWPRNKSAPPAEDDFGIDVEYQPVEQTVDMLPDTRGFRNNNPGNIEYNEYNDWKGQTGSDGRYAIFSEMRWGVRATAKLIGTYNRAYGLNTIRGIIDRWAPDFENNTSSYIASVAEYTGRQPDEVLSLNDQTQLAVLCNAIFRHENGQDLPFSDVYDWVAL